MLVREMFYEQQKIVVNDLECQWIFSMNKIRI